MTLHARGPGGGRTHQALRDAYADVRAGAVTALTGASGAGKSTLLAALGGLIAPDAGRVVPSAGLAAGLPTPMHRWRSLQLAARVGWVPQDATLGLLTRSAIEEVRFTCDRLGRPVSPVRLLRTLGIPDDASPLRLSGGEQRRLAVLAGLVHAPGLALLDEPTVGQDRFTWAAVTSLLAALAGAGAAVAVSTHDDRLVQTLGAEAVRLESGRVAA